MSTWVGKTLGKVQIESLIGRGGVAEVYLGTHTTLERKVAVKILRSLDEENTGALVRFEREARAVAKLRHPNIVQVYDFDTQDSTPYLVMEYVQGPSLSKYLHVLHQNKLRLPIHQAVKLIRAVASALQYAHTNGVIHRDVKPGNILLTSPTSSISLGQPLPEDFEPVLTDFGLVRFLDSGRQTTTGHIAGTPSYMSPEQSRGETTDGRTDIYALGIVLYEMLSGTLPFEGESSVSILLKQVTQQHAPIPGLAPAIQGVLDRVLAKDLNDRYQSAMDFANALCAAAEMKDGASTLQFAEVPTLQFPESTQQPATPAATARPQRRWLPVALVAIAILGSGFFFTQGLPFVGTQDITPTVPSATHALPTASLTITPSASSSPSPVPVITGPIAILRFKNGKSLADQATLIARAMPVPPPGSQYEIWLNGEAGRLSLGVFLPDERGQGELTFSDPEGDNLISRYDTVEITFESTSDSDPEPSGLLAYSYTLPEEELVHIRFLLSTFAKTPDKTGLAQGLYADVKQIAALSDEMQQAVEGSDDAAVRQAAEAALNLLVGAMSEDHKDWNDDGKIASLDSYGLLVNGSNFGYVQSVYAEADVTVHTPGVPQYMAENGEAVKTCTQNLSRWTPEVREALLAILRSTTDTSRSESVRALAALSDQMLNGVDVDNNGKVDNLPGECGAEAVYEYAYYMADMPIMPVSISYQLTVAANPTLLAASPTPGGGDSIQPTPKPKPTQKPKPTARPKPTKKPTKVPKE